MFGIEKTHLLLAFLGMFIHILIKVLNRKDKSTKFSLKLFFSNSKNWIRILLAITSTFSLLLMSEDIGNILGIQLSDGTSAKSILAFMAGYLNHSIIRNILKIFERKNQ
jgi:hypothetical protein